METKRTGTRTALAAAFGLVTTVALLHCSSEEPTEKKSTSTTPGGSSVEEAKQFFIANVYPQYQKSCANGCHDKAQKGAPVYLADNGEGSYNAIEGISGYIAAPLQSPLAQKGLHSGPALTEQQYKLTEDWLTKEVNARKLSFDNSKPPNLREGFRRFGKCMSFKRWTELKLDTICKVPSQGDNNGGPCSSCHISGQSSLWLSPDGAETFAKFTQYPYIQKLVVGRVSASGAFDGLEGSRRLMDKGTEARQPQANRHPPYTLPSELSDNITLFVNETLTNMQNANCEGDRPDAGPDAAK